MKVGNLAYCTKGNNIGRVGTIQVINKFDGNNDLITVRDSAGHQFTTRASYVMVIGNDSKSEVTIPKGNGVFKNILEE
jgi:small subunit ribosomal protein S4e